MRCKVTWMRAQSILHRANYCLAWRRKKRRFIKSEAHMMATKQPPTEPKPDESQELIDTSKMSTGQRAALELTEAARESGRDGTFAGKIFMGEFDLSGIRPYPLQSTEDRDQGDAFLQKLGELLRGKVDPDE